MRWSRENNMVLHEQKFELMVHRASKNPLLLELPFASDMWSYQASECLQISPVIELRDLGVTVNEDLSWSSHIHEIVSKAKSVAAWVLSVFRTRDRNVMLTLYKSLVRSHLEYCCPVWHPKKISDIEEVEEVQRVFTRKILGMESLNYWDRLKRLSLMSLQRR